ncbi:peptide deformylase [Candidatus Curtissbacteria bacterium RIFCSPLOWO2_01_FULL_42_26]|uniref:Peptide deformylase n=1 Tax=Candidatus Curtissbacteria bacterium RIFCSPLOWO2_01_FULL_42_26 TaxID=1797729 RepID=A0A1F5I187_9BACT|nr:MAG: peptide deformylase [Candidatus Curtissbacteria bacterium RIFCSPLOWO2_01_FULL_42_26]
MIKKILTIPNEENLLRQKSKEIMVFDKVLESIINNLTQTLEAQTDPPGLGLSAPQIGAFKRVFVARIRNRIKGFVNPKILKFSKKEIAYLEGCFSVPLLYGHVMRPAEIDLLWQNIQGKKQQNHFKSLPARIIQHEIDHLDGVLFVDHIHNQNGKVFRVEKDKGGNEQFVEVNLGM